MRWLAILVSLLGLQGCGALSPTYTEERDPQTGQITKVALRGDINTITSGDAANTANPTTTPGILGFGGGSRATTFTKVAASEFADNTRPTFKSDATGVEFYGTADRSTPIAAFFRGLTGIAAEVRKGVVRLGMFKTWRDTELGDDEIELAKEDTARAGIARDTRLGVEAERTARKRLFAP